MKFKKIIAFILTLLIASGCSNLNVPKELKEANTNGQYITISFEEYDDMITNSESFVLFLRKDGCAQCSLTYPVLAEVLKNDPNKKIYALEASELESTELIVMASLFYAALGRDYYSENNLEQNLYTPSTVLIENGNYLYAKIGSLKAEEFEYFYQPNFIAVNNYYEYNRQIQIRDKLTVVFSNEEGNSYSKTLRNNLNSNENVLFVNYRNFTENQIGRLVNRINYFLGEENAITSLEDNFVLTYVDNAITSYNQGEILIGVE